MQPEFQAEGVHHGGADFVRNHVGRAVGLVAVEDDAPPLQLVQHVAAFARRMQDVAPLREVVELGQHDAKDGLRQSEAVAEGAQQVQLANVISLSSSAARSTSLRISRRSGSS